MGIDTTSIACDDGGQMQCEVRDAFEKMKQNSKSASIGSFIPTHISTCHTGSVNIVTKQKHELAMGKRSKFCERRKNFSYGAANAIFLARLFWDPTFV